MPKMKTNSGAAKRFKVKKSGKVQFKKANLRHMLTDKTTKSKRQDRAAGYLKTSDLATIRKVMPYA